MSNCPMLILFRTFNNLYGFDTELYRFIHRFTYIIVLLVLILIIYSLKEKLINKKLIISISTMVLVITYLIYILNLTTFVRETNSDYISYMESENYEYEKENFQRENSEVILKNVDIEIDTSRCLEVSGDFTFVTNEKTKDLIFTLYKGFKIKSIKKDNLELKFKQSNNVTQVYLINELKPKENVKLYIEYEGLSAQMYYSSSKAVFLPANFPWLPYMGKELVFYPTYYVPTPLLNDNLVEFNIEYKGNKNYITNLKNSYSSGNEKGLSLIAGNFYKFVNNGTTYISSRFDISSEDTIKSSSKLVEIIDNMRNIIGIENDKFNYICYIDNNNQKVFGNYNSESQIIDNMLIVSLNLLNTDDDYTKEYTTEAIGAIMNSNKDILYKDKTLVDLFHNLFINWYALNYESLKFNPYIPVEDEDYIKNLTHLKSEVSKLSKEQAKEFFTEYYNTLSSEKEVILYDIESILSNVKGEY